jgi:hypothetical protein
MAVGLTLFLVVVVRMLCSVLFAVLIEIFVLIPNGSIKSHIVLVWEELERAGGSFTLRAFLGTPSLDALFNVAALHAFPFAHYWGDFPGQPDHLDALLTDRQ